MKTLILGCGKHAPKQEDQVLVDREKFPNVDVVHDLNVLPWPFQARQFLHVSAIHLVEHLISLIDFMEESWRVLVPGGSLYIETPLAGGDPDLQFADPTHIRCYRPHTWINYFTLEGIEKFGYTEKPWNILALKVEQNIIKIHLNPLKA